MTPVSGTSARSPATMASRRASMSGLGSGCWIMDGASLLPSRNLALPHGGGKGVRRQPCRAFMRGFVLLMT